MKYIEETTGYQSSDKDLLLESYKSVHKIVGCDPSKPGNVRPVFSDDKHYAIYVEALSEGLVGKQAKEFQILAENTRKVVLENSMYGLNPYETLALPLLRVFYPKTITNDLVTVIPMTKPEIVRPFVRASFTQANSSTYHNAPVTGVDISSGPMIGVPVAASATIGATTNIIQSAGLTEAQTHVEKTFTITTIGDGTDTVDVSITATVDGEISGNVTFPTGPTEDIITGRINYETGALDLACVNGNATVIGYTTTLSLEENAINPKAKFSIEKLRLFAKDREISTEWTMQMEQDLKALYDAEVQAELTSVMGQQVTLDIDREVLTNLDATARNLAGAGHVATFDCTPPTGYSWGKKMWLENIIPVLNTLSAQVYNDTNMGSANVMALNPLDAAIFESFDGFTYTGTSSSSGDVGCIKATMNSGKWKILVSSVVTKGKALCIYKPSEDIRAVHIFAPYVPAILTPYPLGRKPSLTLLTRYGQQLIRPQGVAVLDIANS